MITISMPLAPVHCPQTSSLCVCTLGTGEVGKSLLGAVQESHSIYARRLGADYVQITDRSQDWFMAEKFRVGLVAQQYERTLYIDGDVYISRQAPDIFKFVPPGHIGMSAFHPAKREELEWLKTHSRALALSQGIKPLSPYLSLNAGVWVGDRCNANYWTPPTKPIPGNWCDEEFWGVLNVVRKRLPLYLLPDKFNWMWYFDPDFSRWQYGKPWFVHLAGSSSLPKLSGQQWRERFIKLMECSLW